MLTNAAGTRYAGRDSGHLMPLVAAGILLIAIASFGWYGVCSRLMDDDYWLNSGSATDMALTYYMEWSGRFSYAFLAALVINGHPSMVQVLPGAVLGLWLLALLALFRGLLVHRTAPRGRRFSNSVSFRR
jgi:hypothetical protein